MPRRPWMAGSGRHTDHPMVIAGIAPAFLPGRSPNAAEAMDGRERPAYRPSMVIKKSGRKPAAQETTIEARTPRVR